MDGMAGWGDVLMVTCVPRHCGVWGRYGLPDCESAQTLSKLSWINAWVFMHTGLKYHPFRITQTLTTKCCVILINTVY